MEKNLPFGYEYVDGKITVNPVASAILKFRAEKYLEYSNNPPAALVQSVMNDALADGEALTEDEARDRVSDYSIDRYVVAEILANPEWKEYLENNAERQRADRTGAFSGTIKSFKTNTGTTVMAHEEIIDRKTWDAVQGKMKEAMETRFGKISFESE